MKYLYIVLILMVSFGQVAYCQMVGINTVNPQGLFHIDGDNNLVAVGNETINDVIMLTNGNVGIGTVAPSVKLHIQTQGTSVNPLSAFKLVDGSQGDRRVLTAINNTGSAIWSSAQTTALRWDANHRFTIPHTGMYLILLYLDDDFAAGSYTNEWLEPPLQSNLEGKANGVALYSVTNARYLIANCNEVPNYGVSCSGTLLLTAGDVVTPGSIGWRSTSKPRLGIEIIPL